MTLSQTPTTGHCVPHTHASPLRSSSSVRKHGTPMTPSTSTSLLINRAVHQPSPNRTEAAAAMMHLFSSSDTFSPASANTVSASDASKSNDNAQEKLPVHPPLPGAVKAKRKYVRKAPRKPSTAAKKLSTISDDIRLVTPVMSQSERVGLTSPSEDGMELDVEDDPGDQMIKDEGQSEDARFYPFREYNRKEKSLGLLCENFLNLYRSNHVAEICLDRAAVELGVERRRIYDIVNILESIHLVSRKSKNLYNWHGLNALPVSVAAMKRKYAEAGPSTYEFNVKERRRGKSLSKLSQMFVQLFLVKEQCVIPLDQAAKQLIQMKLSENEEDRLLKTKIRRLYDVANVLVSVGLIEKLQLSNSRKPVFRWKTNPETTITTSSSSMTRSPVDVDTLIKSEFPQTPTLTSTRTPSIDEADTIKTSQSCGDSDDSTDNNSCAQPVERVTVTENKRKHCNDVTTLSDEDPNENSFKKTKSVNGSPTTKPSSLLRFDQQQVPIHPQLILQDQQHAVRQFMQQYVREYVDYLILQQVPLATDALSTNHSPVNGNLSCSVNEKDIVAALQNDIHRTPVNQLSSLANRVSAKLVGSINNTLFSSNTTSPQSVADFFYSSDAGRTKVPHAEPTVDVQPSPIMCTNATTGEVDAYLGLSATRPSSMPTIYEIERSTTKL